MVRLVLGIIGGFIIWLATWFLYEIALSGIWPAFGVHQKAFQEAIKNGGSFAADTTILLVHIVLGSLISIFSGSLAVKIAGGNKLAAWILGLLLLGLGLLKAAMSWPYVPIWYHVIFTAILLPMTILGGKTKLVFRKGYSQF